MIYFGRPRSDIYEHTHLASHFIRFISVRALNGVDRNCRLIALSDVYSFVVGLCYYYYHKHTDWYDLCRCSNPTPRGRSDPVLAINWAPLSAVATNVSDPVPYLEINNNLELRRNPEERRLRFWDDIYERYNGPLL